MFQVAPEYLEQGPHPNPHYTSVCTDGAAAMVHQRLCQQSERETRRYCQALFLPPQGARIPADLLCPITPKEMSTLLCEIMGKHLKTLGDKLSFYFPSTLTECFDCVRDPYSSAAGSNRTKRRPWLKLRLADQSLDSFWLTRSGKYQHELSFS